MRDLFPELTNRRNGVAEFGPSLFEMMTDAFFKPMSINTFKVDVQEDSDKYVVEADLPGFQKENIQVDFENDMLTIQATQNHEVEEKNEHGIYIRKERSTGSFIRRFTFNGVENENVKAKFKDGVLTIELPKSNQVKSNRNIIDIE
ncbi:MULTISPECIES: Hsp20/alpha crystallin family protein [unclassified Bacillus cereus group]|uniref:Hsp20/alpha crystallin family protein n=1 Tax=unclassified Bacillus cereus group TaxID=2750818 RepID=UPI001F596AC9|nr:MULTISPECIES: Hsp20/alpha crystallin family protein [unclassified Bacillus cereus group]